MRYLTNRLSLVNIRKWGRAIHRDLSFLFAGALLIYALSGILLNHKRDFNADYSVTQRELPTLIEPNSSKETITEERAQSILYSVDKDALYTKHYFPKDHILKIFVKGGSSLTIDLNTGGAVYEILKRRPLLSAINRLHYNPNRYWTIFSDIFAVSLILIVITGVIITNGKRGLKGRGGIEFLLGLLIPTIFIFLL